MATKKDTTKKGVSDDNNDKSASDYIEEQGDLDRTNDVNDIVANAKKAREMEAAGVDMSNPMEVRLAKEKMDKGEHPDPNAGKLDEEGGDDNLDAHEELDKSEPEMVVVKINGVERKVPQADVDAEGGVIAYQKARSADEKMRQNAEDKKQLEIREAQIAQRELAIATQEQAQLKKENKSGKPSTDASQPSAEAIALGEKMYSGDQDQANEAVDTILERSKPSTPVDTETIVNQTVAKVQWQNDVNSAKQYFATEYSDIDSNPEYRGYADQATKRIMAENPNWTPQQVVTEAGEQARLKFRDQLRENVKADEDENRMNNKRTTDNVRGNDATVQKKPEQKAKTQKQIIADMQKNRSHASD
ncbi:MAG: hypothetical protein ABUK13_02705 [Gammaproteobacteria bacterium]